MTSCLRRSIKWKPLEERPGIGRMASLSSSQIRFTPLSGARQEGTPACYILEIGQTRILLDCGTPSSLSCAHLNGLNRYVGKNRIDAVLLSHSSLRYCGGLPWIVGLLGLTCPVLATVPVHHLGRLALYDAFQSVEMSTGLPPSDISLDMIDTAFEHITLLRYSQTFSLSNGDVLVSAVPAGHTVGGAIWKIKSGDDQVVYAPAFNHRREMHLDGAPFELLPRQMNVFITGAGQGLVQSVARKTRDETLLNAITSTCKSGGNVLMPVDTASRTLELLQLLLHSSIKTEGWSLCLLSHQSRRTVELAKGMLEWMGQAMMKTFETERKNPFELGNIKLCHSLPEVMANPEPRIVLASLEDMEAGWARSLLTTWASQPKSILLFTNPPAPGTLAHQLLPSDSKTPLKIALQVYERVPLAGQELKDWHRARQEEKERAEAEASFAELIKRRQAEEDIMNDGGDEEDDDGEDGNLMAGGLSEIDKIEGAKALREIYWTDYRFDWHNNIVNDSTSLEYPLMAEGDSSRTTLLLGKLARHQVFPFQHLRQRIGDYGIPIDPSDFADPNAIEPKSPDETVEPKVAAVPAKETQPTKLIDYVKEVTVRCRRMFVDCSGLVDGRSLRTILAQLDPRHTIFIGGPPSPTDYLLSHSLFLDAKTEAETAFAPAIGETVRVRMAEGSRHAFLAEGVISQLDMILFKDVELARVRAAIQMDNNDMDVDDDGENGKMVLVPETEGVTPTRQPLLIGDPKLHELRTILSTPTTPASFQAADLIIGSHPENLIRLAKDGDRITLEGGATPDYYRVRHLLYSSLAII